MVATVIMVAMVMVVMVVVVNMVIIVVRTGQDRTKLTSKLDFPGSLCLPGSFRNSCDVYKLRFCSSVPESSFTPKTWFRIKKLLQIHILPLHFDHPVTT